jgi:hypothetical protein
VCRFANPEDFFLYFCKPLISTFDGKIAASDHHSDFGAAHRRQK